MAITLLHQSLEIRTSIKVCSSCGHQAKRLADLGRVEDIDLTPTPEASFRILRLERPIGIFLCGPCLERALEVYNWQAATIT